MFRPDQLVVCVDDRTARERGIKPPPGYLWYGDMHGLRRGEVYTIRAIGVSHFNGEPVVFLEEIVRPLQPNGVEAAFAIDRFRPLDDSKLSIFREMLAPSPDVIAEYVMEDDTARIDAAAEAITRSISG